MNAEPLHQTQHISLEHHGSREPEMYIASYGRTFVVTPPKKYTA